jgi:hypothetical protein
VKKTAAEKAAHRDSVLGRPKAGDLAGLARLAMRKAEAGVADRDDIRCFVDAIDADEQRLT